MKEAVRSISTTSRIPSNAARCRAKNAVERPIEVGPEVVSRVGVWSVVRPEECNVEGFVTLLASPYLTAAEAAAFIRSSAQGIYSLVKRGKTKPMPGRQGRLPFTREALDDYLGGKRRR